MLAQWILALFLTAVAGLSDLITGRIPNQLTLIATVLALGLNGFQGVSVFGLGLIGGIVCSTVPLLLYRWSSDAIGGGDIKLFAALGVLLGPTLGLETQLAAYLVSSTCAFSKLAFQGELRRVFANAIELIMSLVRQKTKPQSVATELLTPVRIGPAIFVSCVLEAWRSSGLF